MSLRRAYLSGEPLRGSLERAKARSTGMFGNAKQPKVGIRCSTFAGMEIDLVDDPYLPPVRGYPDTELDRNLVSPSIGGRLRSEGRCRARVCVNRLLAHTWKTMFSEDVVRQYPHLYDFKSGRPYLRVDTVNTTVAMPGAMRRPRSQNSESQNRFCQLERMIQYIRKTSGVELCSKRSLTSKAGVAALCRKICRVIQSTFTSTGI